MYPGQQLESMIDKLYVRTGGHTRTLLQTLMSADPLTGPDPLDLLEDVRRALELYPDGLRALFDQRHGLIEAELRKLGVRESMIWKPPPENQRLSEIELFVLNLSSVVLRQKFLERAMHGLAPELRHEIMEIVEQIVNYAD